MASAAVRLLRSCCPKARITLTVPPDTIPLVNDPALVTRSSLSLPTSPFPASRRRWMLCAFASGITTPVFTSGNPPPMPNAFSGFPAFPSACARRRISTARPAKRLPSVPMSCPRVPCGQAMRWTGSKTSLVAIFRVQAENGPPSRLSPTPCLRPLKNFFRPRAPCGRMLSWLAHGTVLMAGSFGRSSRQAPFFSRVSAFYGLPA